MVSPVGVVVVDSSVGVVVASSVGVVAVASVVGAGVSVVAVGVSVAVSSARDKIDSLFFMSAAMKVWSFFWVASSWCALAKETIFLVTRLDFS